MVINRNTKNVDYCDGWGHCTDNKASLGDLIAVADLIILIKLDSSHLVLPHMTSKFDGWPRKTIGHIFYATSSFVHHFKAIGDFKLELLPKTLNSAKISQFLSRGTLKFDGWPRKTIGHLFYATSSFVYYFIAMCEFKLELRSGNG